MVGEGCTPPPPSITPSPHTIETQSRQVRKTYVDLILSLLLIFFFLLRTQNRNPQAHESASLGVGAGSGERVCVVCGLGGEAGGRLDAGKVWMVGDQGMRSLC